MHKKDQRFSAFEEHTTYLVDYKWPEPVADTQNVVLRPKKEKKIKQMKTTTDWESYVKLPIVSKKRFNKYYVPEKINEIQPIFDLRKYKDLSGFITKFQGGHRKAGSQTFNPLSPQIEDTEREELTKRIICEMYATVWGEDSKLAVTNVAGIHRPIEELYRPPPEHLSRSFEPNIPLSLGWKKAARSWDEHQVRGEVHKNMEFWKGFVHKPASEQVLNEMLPSGFGGMISELVVKDKVRQPYCYYPQYTGHKPIVSQYVSLEKNHPITVVPDKSLTHAYMSRRLEGCLPDDVSQHHSSVKGKEIKLSRPEFMILKSDVH